MMGALIFVFIIIGLLPVCCGMVKAFFAGKLAGSTAYETSPGIWYGYVKGTQFSIILFFALSLIMLVIASLGGGADFIEAFMAIILLTAFYVLFSGVIGFVLYTAPAFFGYGIGKQAYVSKLLEKEANKTREEIENDIRAKQSLKRPLN